MYAAGHTKGHNGHEQRNAMVGYVNLLPVLTQQTRCRRDGTKQKKSYNTGVTYRTIL